MVNIHSDLNFTELLAPAGSAETAKAAIRAGADAVYIGGAKFGARAYADNPEEASLMEVMDYIHIRDKKMYLTVNTLLKEEELKRELFSFLNPLYANGLDAVIVQDAGVFSFIRREFPDLPIHASTQMAITGPEGAALLYRSGATRVVTARELSLKEIREIRKHVPVEIESFVHGALCYCYSGRCLLSSMLGGRSGNRGRCAQPCRLPYEVIKNNRKLNRPDEKFMLSPRDMCTIELLPEILKAGVNSLKIEGRMKKPEYTAGVVSIYREYLNRCLEGSFDGVSKKDMQLLMDLYNRDGFHQGYYRQHNGKRMMALKNEKLSKTSADRNHDLFSQIHEQYCTDDPPMPISGQAGFFENEPMQIFLTCADVSSFTTGPVVETAKNQPMDSEKLKKQLNKTGDSGFTFASLEIETSKMPFVSVKEVNQLRRQALGDLKNELLRPFIREKKDEPAMWEERIFQPKPKTEAVFSVLVNTREQLTEVLKHRFICKRLYIEYSLWLKEKDYILDSIETFTDIQWMLALPQMLRENVLEDFKTAWKHHDFLCFSGFLIRTMEEAALLLEYRNTNPADGFLLILDDCMYTYNSESMDFFRALSIDGFTAPAELNKKELKRRDNHDSEIMLYGRQILMVSAQCLQKNTAGCDHAYGILSLKDRKNITFPAKCCCDFCYNILYNSLPTSLFKEFDDLKADGFTCFRLVFTTESAARTSDVLSAVSSLKAGEKPSLSGDFTKGHYQRGVE